MKSNPLITMVAGSLLALWTAGCSHAADPALREPALHEQRQLLQAGAEQEQAFLRLQEQVAPDGGRRLAAGSRQLAQDDGRRTADAEQLRLDPTEPGCPRAAPLAEHICLLAGRICQIGERHPGERELAARCTDARRRCESARELYTRRCPQPPG